MFAKILEAKNAFSGKFNKIYLSYIVKELSFSNIIGPGFYLFSCNFLGSLPWGTTIKSLGASDLKP